ncbi:MAG: T4 RnlA family RNA ligase [Coleofasciculus sp. S288]|nr:T4 RnlA family RNA ligase [Coleofasciculus sp. S288]
MSKSNWRSFKASLEHKGKIYILKGRIHLRCSVFPGEVEVISINDIPTNQVLPGMPEIPYTTTLSHPFSLPAKPIAASFTLKMDGTAILFSPLSLPDGEVAVFPRTRGMVIIQDTKWRALRTLVEQALDDKLHQRITAVCRQQNATLVFELWGANNQHTVQYDTLLRLSLHTMIKGRNALQPWRLVKQVAKAYSIPIVDELVRVAPSPLREQTLLQMGQKLVIEQENENNPQMGLYRYEGVVLNIETQSRGWQWKFKPRSMEEYHRLARVKIMPVTVFHLLWKLVDRGEEVSLAALLETMIKEYGHEAVSQQQSAIARHYWFWLSKYYDMTVSPEDVTVRFS